MNYNSLLVRLIILSLPSCYFFPERKNIYAIVTLTEADTLAYSLDTMAVAADVEIPDIVNHVVHVRCMVAVRIVPIHLIPNLSIVEHQELSYAMQRR